MGLRQDRGGRLQHDAKAAASEQSVVQGGVESYFQARTAEADGATHFDET